MSRRTDRRRDPARSAWRPSAPGDFRVVPVQIPPLARRRNMRVEYRPVAGSHCHALPRRRPDRQLFGIAAGPPVADDESPCAPVREAGRRGPHQAVEALFVDQVQQDGMLLVAADQPIPAPDRLLRAGFDGSENRRRSRQPVPVGREARRIGYGVHLEEMLPAVQVVEVDRSVRQRRQLAADPSANERNTRRTTPPASIPIDAVISRMDLSRNRPWAPRHTRRPARASSRATTSGGRGSPLHRRPCRSAPDVLRPARPEPLMKALPTAT